MSYVVRVEYQDYDQDTEIDIHGPFASRGTAARFVEKVANALGVEFNHESAYAHYTLEGADGSVFVSVQSVQLPRVRPIAGQAKGFLQGLLPEEGGE